MGGTKLPRSLRRYVALTLVFGFTSIFIVLMLKQRASDRAITFTKAIYSGEHVRMDEWFAAQGQRPGAMSAFGGITELVRNESAYAVAKGGVRAVTARSRLWGVRILVDVTTSFADGRATTTMDLWEIEGGSWKIVPTERGVENRKAP